MSEIKSQYRVPVHLRSCHTAIVDGYIIEGHVPVAAIEKLLQTRPDIVGLSVPGMPVGSPGMESETVPAEAYHVIAFDRNGQTGIFLSIPAEDGEQKR